MDFEYDPEKSRKNKEKHGIDFEEAQELWNGDYMEIPAKNEGGERFMVIGKILAKFWSAVITYRDAMIRLISVRRSTDKEKITYEDNYHETDNS